MKVQQINSNHVNPNFSAKLSPQTLKTLSKEIEMTPKGHGILKQALEGLKSVGNKDTVISIGELYKGEEMVSIYHDEPDVAMPFQARLVQITNPLMPNAYHSFEQRYSNDTLLDTVNGLVKYEKNFYSEEAKLFEKYLVSEKTSYPLEVFKNIAPFLKANKDSFEALFNVAVDKNDRILRRWADDLDQKEKDLQAEGEIFIKTRNNAKAYIEEIKNEIRDDKVISERDKIINEYV